MIARLRGELVEAGGGRVVVDCAGVGYEALIPESAMVRIPPVGSFVDLHTRQVFREDGQYLYAFTEAYERTVFDMLTDVKGCGPKIALALLSDVGAEAVISAIVAQDARALTRASGVGPRLGERIALELRDRAQQEALGQQIVGSSKRKAPLPEEDELVEALMALGYRRSEIDGVIDEARQGASDVQGQLRIALRTLQR